ncbi:MAG: hypothetical protein LBQ81_06690 [Zoogloeaceae bacterium]|nr:hypothetical protein [Zoogloeaceae bacterium]
MLNAEVEKTMQEILAEMPKGSGITSGLAFGEENQRALDAWIAAGAVPGDEHLYGRFVDDEEKSD